MRETQEKEEGVSAGEKRPVVIMTERQSHNAPCRCFRLTAPMLRLAHLAESRVQRQTEESRNEGRDVKDPQHKERNCSLEWIKGGRARLCFTVTLNGDGATLDHCPPPLTLYYFCSPC